MKQCYFMACELNGKPIKISLQEEDCVKAGRVYATKNPDKTVVLYQQPITRTGEVEEVRTLHPYK